MASKLLMDLKKQEATDVESGEEFFDLEIASNPKHVEVDDHVLQSRGLLSVSNKHSRSKNLGKLVRH